jgi:hypothetical protein
MGGDSTNIIKSFSTWGCKYCMDIQWFSAQVSNLMLNGNILCATLEHGFRSCPVWTSSLPLGVKRVPRHTRDNFRKMG